MNSVSSWASDRLEPLAPNGGRPPSSPHKITTVKELAIRLLREVQSIREVEVRSFGRGGVDFYAEVDRFEIDLIKCALLQTAGHQRQAALLLNLNATTLNSKIKHHKINLGGFERTGRTDFESIGADESDEQSVSTR